LPKTGNFKGIAFVATIEKQTHCQKLETSRASPSWQLLKNKHIAKNWKLQGHRLLGNL
jgi:hypothetical protein